jgi:uncharacterized protein (TIGR02246 family)
MDEAQMYKLADEFLEAWNSQDVERVVAIYTDDVTYVDPNTRGAVKGADALRRYLRKLFAGWKMRWALREAYLLDGRNGCAILWHATFQTPGGGTTVEADGMDLVIVRDGRVERNEVCFDRTVLAPLWGVVREKKHPVQTLT